MITPTVFTLFVAAGSVLCDTSSHPEAGVQHSTLVEPLVSQQTNVVDTQYYTQYPGEQQYQGEQFPTTGSGYYDYSTLGQELTDRTDGTILGGLTIGVILTIFLAAMLGALVAPIITGAVTRVSDAIPVPEITIPGPKRRRSRRKRQRRERQRLWPRRKRQRRERQRLW